MKKIALLIWSVFPIFLLSQNCECSKALQQDIVSYNFDKISFMHYMKLINIDNYEQFRKTATINTTIPIDLIPVTNSSSYSEFSLKRNKLYLNENFITTEQISEDYISKKTSELGYRSYDNCLKICSNTTGVYLTVNYSDSSTISLEIKYVASAGINFPLIITSSQLINATFNGKNKLLSDSTKLLPGSTQIIVLKRNNNLKAIGAINGSMNGAIYSNSFSVDPFYIPRKDTITEIIRLKENEICNLEQCRDYKDIIDIKYLQCSIPREADSDIKEAVICVDPLLSNIKFGPWSNDECSTSGTGWSITSGSCTKGSGSLRKRCEWVDVKISYIVIH